jgi:serine-type D-Ala-D-Ala carboxypeptidase (penicillin-binding protein 5/6)
MRAPRLAAALVGVALVTGLTASPASAEPIGGAQLTGSGIVVDPGPTATPLPDVGATTWLLADLDSGAILAARGPHVQRPPASTFKTLTALTLIPRLDAEEVYTATYDDIAVEGSRVGLVDDGEYTISELFLGLFLQSGNDAAMALANANGGMELTIAQMSEELQRLQAYDTVAKNTSGLPAEGQVSSAYDLALIAREGLQDPAFLSYATTISVPDYPGYMPTSPGEDRSTFTIANQNPLLNPIDGRAPYAGAIGLKTGWTTEAGKTFIGAARRGGTGLVVTLMNFSGPTYDAAAPLLDWGFENIDAVSPVGYLVDPIRPAVDEASPTAAPTPQPVIDPAGVDTTGAASPAAPETSAVSTAVAVGTNGWAWGLLAAMVVGALLVIMGIRSLRPPAPRPRRNYAERTARGTPEALDDTESDELLAPDDDDHLLVDTDHAGGSATNPIRS